MALVVFSRLAFLAGSFQSQILTTPSQYSLFLSQQQYGESNDAKQVAESLMDFADGCLRLAVANRTGERRRYKENCPDSKSSSCPLKPLPIKFSQEDLYCSYFDDGVVTVVLTVISPGRGSDVDL